jgi:hypothetical protein
MRQISYPAALGSCVLGAGAAPLRAAEWSITPSYSSSVDYDSNRRLSADEKGSDATVLGIDLKLKRALENLELTLEPRYALRRFSDPTLGNGDDRSIAAAANWSEERSLLNLTASYFDQSTLYAELLETGLVNADTHRRQSQAGATWNWTQTERRAVVAQFSYLDVSYYGSARKLLPGYRYPSGSIGEQFLFNERGSVTLSAFGSKLDSTTQGNSSRETGAQAEIAYALSERAKIDASVGRSTRVLSGQSSPGTDAALSFDYSLVSGRLNLTYKRSLVPYGLGFLVEQQQYTFNLARPLSPYWDTTLGFYRIQNNETAVLLGLDRRNFNDLSGGLNWHPAETWSVGALIERSWTQTADRNATPVNRWHSSISITWSPFPASRSW